jgi:pectate lyase
MIVVVEVVNLRTMMMISRDEAENDDEIENEDDDNIMVDDVDMEDVGLGGNEHGSDGL